MQNPIRRTSSPKLSGPYSLVGHSTSSLPAPILSLSSLGRYPAFIQTLPCISDPPRLFPDECPALPHPAQLILRDNEWACVRWISSEFCPQVIVTIHSLSGCLHQLYSGLFEDGLRARDLCVSPSAAILDRPVDNRYRIKGGSATP